LDFRERTLKLWSFFLIDRAESHHTGAVFTIERGMSHRVISLLFHGSERAIENHRNYARTHGYRHRVIDASDIYTNAPAQWLFKYEALLRELNDAQAGEIVLLLSENALIVESVPLEIVLGSRDWLLTRVLERRPQADVQLWRNTERVRGQLLHVVHRCRFGCDLPAVETELLDMFESTDYSASVRDEAGALYPVLLANGPLEPVWLKARVFALSIQESPTDLQHASVHPRLREALFSHMESGRENHKDTFSIEVSRTDQCEVINPGLRIAIMTLYTPNAAIYGRIAEANMREYCERHGYTLYVHRDIPAHIFERLPMRGNWVKPYLLQDYLPRHDWTIWLDADTLVNDLSRPLEPLLADRDVLLARDIGRWLFNSGVMGFRNTEANAILLDKVIERIEHIDDKASVRDRGGDQFHFNSVLSDDAGLTNDDILNLLDINTPWGFRQPDSFIVHYHGMSAAMRALLMRYDLALTDANAATATPAARRSSPTSLQL
jgi:hypothetical protein